MDRQSSFTSSPPGEEVAQSLQRKVAVLKKALIKEREEKQKEFEEVEKMKKKLSILELTLSEKDSQIQMRNYEREQLEKELEKLIENSKQTSPTLFQGSKKSVSTLEQQNKKFLEEFHYLRSQNADLKSKYSAITSQHQEIQKQISLKNNHLDKVSIELEQSLLEVKHQEEIASKELFTAKNMYLNISDNQNKLKNEISETLLKKKKLEDDIIFLSKELQSKQVQVARLNERLLKQSENEATLSSKLMQYKNELVEAESYYQKHEVMKLNNLNNHPAIIVLKHDHTGEYVIEIEERKNKTLDGINNVECIAKHPHTERRFYIRFVNGQVQEFESNETESIVGKMNFFLQKAKEERLV